MDFYLVYRTPFVSVSDNDRDSFYIWLDK